MGPESDLHRRLKRVATRWLWDQGYAAVAEEVTVPGVGIEGAIARSLTADRIRRGATTPFDRFDSPADLSAVGRQVS